jgi:hypothetical protein
LVAPVDAEVDGVGTGGGSSDAVADTDDAALDVAVVGVGGFAVNVGTVTVDVEKSLPVEVPGSLTVGLPPPVPGSFVVMSVSANAVRTPGERDPMRSAGTIAPATTTTLFHHDPARLVLGISLRTYHRGAGLGEADADGSPGPTAERRDYFAGFFGAALGFLAAFFFGATTGFASGFASGALGS